VVAAALAAVLAVAIGASIALDPTVGFVLAVTAVGLCGVAAPAGAWVVGALVAALTLRSLVSLGALPPVATFLDLPLAWAALGVALIRTRSLPHAATRHLRWLLALAIAIFAAALVHPADPLRPVVYLMLLGEPFAIVGALLIDPPSASMRRVLVGAAAGLLLLQVVVAAGQFLAFGIGDAVQGTLYGAGAGHHTIGAVAAVGAVWALTSGALSLVPRLVAAGALLAVPIVADARQVLVALPAILLGVRWRLGRAGIVLGVAVIALPIIVLSQLSVGAFSVERTLAGQAPKLAATDAVWDAVTNDPQSLAFGLGPAQTVSRAAFLTQESFQQPDSALELLELEPATFPFKVQVAAQSRAEGESSVNSGLSSALGVLGDLGLVGAAAYLATLVGLFLALRRSGSPHAVAASGGFALFATLGVIFDWWEQPPFSVFLAVLAGLALTQHEPGTERTARPVETGVGSSGGMSG
jgi:hypothetical protein